MNKSVNHVPGLKRKPCPACTDIRSAIQSDLAMISGKDLDWQKLTADTEWLGIRMEEESDLARRQEAQDRTRWRSDWACDRASERRPIGIQERLLKKTGN